MKRISTSLTCLFLLAACSSEKTDNSESIAPVTTPVLGSSDTSSNSTSVSGTEENGSQSEQNEQAQTSEENTNHEADTEANGTDVNENGEQGTNKDEQQSSTADDKNGTQLSTPDDSQPELQTGLSSDKTRLATDSIETELTALTDILNQKAFDSFSPIYHTFQHVSLLYPATNGQARLNVESYLNLVDSASLTTPSQFLQTLNHFDQLLNDRDITTSASVWGHVDYPFAPDFADDLAQNFSVSLRSSDMEASSDEIEEEVVYWINNNTLPVGHNPYVSSEQTTKLIVANGHNASLNWEHTFAVENTTEQDFYYTAYWSEPVDMMTRQLDINLYLDDEVTFVGIPLENPDWSAYFVKTNSVDDYDSYQAEFAHQTLLELIPQTSLTTVELTLPRVTKIYFSDVPSQLTNIRSDSMADLSNLNQENIADVYMRSSGGRGTLIIDEAGIRTSFYIKSTFEIKPEPKNHFEHNSSLGSIDAAVGLYEDEGEEIQPMNVIFDRPFMYFIVHQPTNTVMYLGQVTSFSDIN